MSRRGRMSSQISLFAFQDIITSVTAIIIVMVLMMSLDLINAKKTEGSPAPVTPKPDRIEELQTLKDQLAKLEMNSTAKTVDFELLGKSTPASLARELKSLEEEIEIRTRDVETRKKEDKRLREEVSSSQKESDSRKVDRTELQKNLQEIQRMKEQLKKDRKGGQMVIALPKGFEGEGWVCVIDEQQLTMAPLRKKGSVITLRSKGILSNSTAEEFTNWVDAQSQSRSYFLFLVRPDAPKHFSELEEELKKQKIRYGFDVIDRYQHVIDPERGVEAE